MGMNQSLSVSGIGSERAWGSRRGGGGVLHLLFEIYRFLIIDRGIQRRPATIETALSGGRIRKIVIRLHFDVAVGISDGNPALRLGGGARTIMVAMPDVWQFAVCGAHRSRA